MYEATGYYRPQADCIMFTRDEVGFCAVCRRAIERVIDLYTQGRLRAMRRRGPRRLLPLLAAARRRGRVPQAVVVLESAMAPAARPGAEAAPPRFVLLEDGQVFVGGTSGVAVGQLTRAS